MKQGIQADFKNIDNVIYEYGCYFLDILRWAELDSGKDFDIDAVLNIYSLCKKAGYIGAECFIYNAPSIYYAASGIEKYKYIEKRQSLPLKDKYIICNKKPMFTHFTLFYQGEVWDSLPPDRPGVAAYKPDSYRVLV